MRYLCALEEHRVSGVHRFDRDKDDLCRQGFPGVHKKRGSWQDSDIHRCRLFLFPMSSV